MRHSSCPKGRNSLPSQQWNGNEILENATQEIIRHTGCGCRLSPWNLIQWSRVERLEVAGLEFLKYPELIDE
jgi:hypothetical protein